MEQAELFRRLAVAPAIGLLIDLERGWQLRQEAGGERIAGFRTFALTGLFGGICAAISTVGSPLVLPAALLASAAAFTLFSWVTNERSFSVTGVVVAMLTFALGAHAVLGQPTVAVAAAVAMAILLALEAPLHNHDGARRGDRRIPRAAMLLLGRGKTTLGGTPVFVLGNPFDLATVLKLAALIAIVMVSAEVLSTYIGARGLYLLAAVSGVADVDALTLSVARPAGGQVAAADATGAILLAVGMNTAAMAAHLGGRSIGAPVCVGSALAMVALAATHAFIRL